MPKRVLVIGGGVAGMASALEVTANGLEACLVEKAADIGGRAINYCCKATDKCNHCSACLVPQIKKELQKNKRVTIYTNSVVTGVSGEAGEFTVQIQTPDQTIALEVSAIIIAIGFNPFDIANKRKEYGYAINKKVITGLEFEQALKEKGSLSASFGPAQNIGFIQCVGSRDLSFVNSDYCSKVCCMYATKLARLVRAELPETAIAIFYMDLQTFGQGFDRFIEEAKNDDNIQFIRGTPSKIYSTAGGQLKVKYANTLTGDIVENIFDLIVLSTAITPSQDTNQIATMLNITTDEYGFFKANARLPFLTAQEGVFIAGTCQSPKDIPQTITQAKAAASAAVALLQK